MIKRLQVFSSSFLIAFPLFVAVKDLIGMPYVVTGRSMQVSE